MFEFIKRKKKSKVQEDSIPLMDAETARKVYLETIGSNQRKEWGQAKAAIPQIAKAIAKASANGDYKLKYATSGENIARKIASLLKEKGYEAHVRYGSCDLDIMW